MLCGSRHVPDTGAGRGSLCLAGQGSGSVAWPPHGVCCDHVGSKQAMAVVRCLLPAQGEHSRRHNVTAAKQVLYIAADIMGSWFVAHSSAAGQGRGILATGSRAAAAAGIPGLCSGSVRFPGHL